MIVLDTNVVSELMRPAPDGRVVAWVDGQEARDVRVAAMTAAELLAGVRLLPAGARRERIGVQVAALLGNVLAGRILPFTAEAAVHYADLVATRSRSGDPISTADAVIAATARAAGADRLATRNIRDFTGTGLRLTDPWIA